MTLSEKIYHKCEGGQPHPIVPSYHCFQTKNKNENTECHSTFIALRSPLLKTREPHFSLVWLMECKCLKCLSQSFFNNSNLIFLILIQCSHENSKSILIVSNGVYILFKRRFPAVPHCFIKLFHSEQS